MRLPLADRIAALSQRERIFLAVGGAVVLVFFLYMLLPGGDEAEPVELTPSPPAAASPAAPPPMTTPVAVAPPPPAAPQADPAAAAGLILRGTMGGGPGGGAVIVADAAGAQRVVRVGRNLLPGMVLQQVGINYAVASAAGGSVRLELNKPGAVAVASEGAPAPASASARASAPSSERRETLQYRLGLQPVRSNGRVVGHAIKAGAAVPHFDRAGLQPGDIVTKVNGSMLDEERLMELSWTIANSHTVEIEYIRNGKTMKAAVDKSSLR